MKYYHVIASPDRKAFFDVGTNNGEHDGPMVVSSFTDATLFRSEEAANDVLEQPKTKAHWGSKELVTFLRTAEVRKVRVAFLKKDI